jgi:hypothetical protein
MRKSFSLLLVVVLLNSLHNILQAQCSTPCPSVITLSDTIGCNNIELRKTGAIGSGYSNNHFIIRACKNSKMKYCLNINDPCYAGTTYNLINISGGSIVNFTGNCFTVQWSNAASGIIDIGFSTPGSAGLPPCIDTIHINYTLLNSPFATFTAIPNPACFNNPTTINFNSTGTTNTTNYFWDFGDGFTSLLANPSHNYTLPGTYTVVLTASNIVSFNGQPVCPTCSDTATQTVIINNLPAPDITCVASVCAGATKTYCTSASGCSSYVWTVTGGTITSGQNTNCITVLWGSGSPQGTINLVATGCVTTYCPQGNTVTIPIIPTTGTIIGNNLVCVNTTESYTLPAWPGTTYNWNLATGGVISPFNTNTNQVNVNWTTIGIHTLTCSYFDTALNCGGTANFTVFVRPTMTITGPTTVCAGQTTNLNAVRPTNIAVNCNWTITPSATINSGNGTNSINVTWPNVLIPTTYTVNATAVILNQVCNVASYIVTVNPAPIISAIIGKDSICPGQTYVYKATSNATGTFFWSTTNATSTSVLGVNNDSIQVTWATSGAYSISVFQIAIPSGCISNTFTKNIFKYPTPTIVGPLSVCADATVTYTVTNILNGNFNWFVTPPSFGTILSGQGTNSITIKWHGNNSPGSSNTVYLHFGVCNNDSIAITINEPPIPTIIASGTLCGATGVTLNTGATGTFSWTGPSGPLGGNTPSISNINTPGNYVVVINNFNGTGCTVTTNYNVPDVGRPIASISATNTLQYCLPNLPNMNLVAVNGPGYAFQWYNSAGILLGQTNPTLLVNNLTTAGTYTYYCMVTLGTCLVTSNIITITIANCPPPTGCSASINVTSITGCNPFNITIAATAPTGATLSGTGNPTIQHLEDGYTVSGLTTRTYTSIGYKQIRVCADVLLPNSTICRVCKDTIVNVTVAADFTSIVGCKKINLFDASTVVAPATISSYAWSVGTNPGNFAVPLLVASFNNPAIANPVLTVNISGSYIVSLSITSGSCIVTVRDTFNISVPNASFAVPNSCVGTTVTFNNAFAAPTNFWDFGDAATSYTSPTFHAYGTPGTYNVTHIVTDVNGCKDTVVKPITIVPAPLCTVTNSTPLTFCFGDSVVLGSSCTGLVNFQWYNNGVAIPGQIFALDTVKQTGNYSFIAFDINGCKVISDTVTVTVNQAPNATIIKTGNGCSGTSFTVFVPSCLGCTYQWLVDGNPVANTNQFTSVAGLGIYSVGTHTIQIIVTNPLGCSNTSTITQTFNALPSISINVVGPTPICSNNLYTLTATSNASSPSWAWTLNNINIVLSTTASLNASAAGNYFVLVTDGVTGCKASTFQTILPSPELNLFPIGCDSLCDTSHVFLPLQSFNGNLTGYNIDWYDNAPPYLLPIGNGIFFPLNTLSLGSHNLSVIVTSPNGCKDTSNVYSIYVKSCNLALPIKEIVFTAKQIGSTAILNWSTIQEMDNAYFVIERSLNGIDFVYAGKVWSKGNSIQKQYYNFNDPITNFNQTIFYRLKLVDKTGRIEYSSVIKLNPQKITTEQLVVIPTLVKDKVQLFMQSNSNSNTNISIFTTNGKLVSKEAKQVVKGMNNYILDCSKLASGTYLISTNTKDKQFMLKIVKQ